MRSKPKGFFSAYVVNCPRVFSYNIFDVIDYTTSPLNIPEVRTLPLMKEGSISKLFTEYVHFQKQGKFYSWSEKCASRVISGEIYIIGSYLGIRDIRGIRQEIMCDYVVYAEIFSRK